MIRKCRLCSCENNYTGLNVKVRQTGRLLHVGAPKVEAYTSYRTVLKSHLNNILLCIKSYMSLTVILTLIQLVEFRNFNAKSIQVLLDLR